MSERTGTSYRMDDGGTNGERVFEEEVPAPDRRTVCYKSEEEEGLTVVIVDCPRTHSVIRQFLVNTRRRLPNTPLSGTPRHLFVTLSPGLLDLNSGPRRCITDFRSLKWLGVKGGVSLPLSCWLKHSDPLRNLLFFSF